MSSINETDVPRPEDVELPSVTVGILSDMDMLVASSMDEPEIDDPALSCDSPPPPNEASPPLDFFFFNKVVSLPMICLRLVVGWDGLFW